MEKRNRIGTCEVDDSTIQNGVHNVFHRSSTVVPVYFHEDVYFFSNPALERFRFNRVCQQGHLRFFRGFIPLIAVFGTGFFFLHFPLHRIIEQN